jgi:hypothetical protein
MFWNPLKIDESLRRWRWWFSNGRVLTVFTPPMKVGFFAPRRPPEDF